MTSGTHVDGRVRLARTDVERTPRVRRLGRIEGKVRGLRAMIEADRHRHDEIRQIRAVTAALREVARPITGREVTEA